MGAVLFADDLVGVIGSKEGLQKPESLLLFLRNTLGTFGVGMHKKHEMRVLVIQ